MKLDNKTLAVLTILVVAFVIFLFTPYMDNEEKENRRHTVKIERQRLRDLELKQKLQREADEIETKKRIEEHGLDLPIFNVKLGEKCTTFRTRTGCSPNGYYHYADDDKLYFGNVISFSTFHESIKEFWIYTFMGNNVNRSNVYRTGRIFKIEIKFKDGSRSNFEAMQDILIEKYKDYDISLIDTLFGENNYNIKINGIDVRIKLNHDIRFSTEDTLELTYTHIPLQSEFYGAVKKRKADRLNKDIF